MNVSKYLLLGVNSFVTLHSLGTLTRCSPPRWFLQYSAPAGNCQVYTLCSGCLPPYQGNRNTRWVVPESSNTENMQSRGFNRFSSPSLWIFICCVTNFGRNPEQASSHLNWAFPWSDLLQGLLQDVYSFPSSYFILENHAVFLWFNDDKTQSIYQDESALGLLTPLSPHTYTASKCQQAACWTYVQNSYDKLEQSLTYSLCNSSTTCTWVSKIILIAIIFDYTVEDSWISSWRRVPTVISMAHPLQTVLLVLIS